MFVKELRRERGKGGREEEGGREGEGEGERKGGRKGGDRKGERNGERKGLREEGMENENMSLPRQLFSCFVL